MRYRLFLPLFLISLAGHAGQPPAMPDIGDYRSDAIRQKSSNKIEEVAEASKAGAIRALPDIGVNKTQGIDIEQIATRYREIGKKPQHENLMVFVSTSMPMASLVKLGKQSSKAGAVMVLRGIPGGVGRGSWTKAMAALKPIVDTGASIQIHPDLFKLYEVRQVPTFILAKAEQSECVLDSTRCQSFLKASGDVSLDYVLDRWSDGKGDLAGEARSRLDRISGGRQ